MRHRFLFVNAKGVEVKVPSADRLAHLHEAGELSEDTLLYDVVTREWAPARTHPVCRFMLEADDETDAAAASTPEASGNADVVQDPSGSAGEPDDDLDLAPDTGEILGDLELIESDADDMVDSFLAAREREREEERMSGVSREKEIELVGPDLDGLGYPLSRDPEVEAARSRKDAERQQEPPEGAEGDRITVGGDRVRSTSPGVPGPDSPAASASGEGAAVRDDAPETRRRVRRESASAFRSAMAGSGASILRQVALLVLLLGVGGWGIADAWSAPLPPPTPNETMIPSTPPRPPGPLAAANVSLVPEDALAQMATSMEGLRTSMRLGEPPAVWMASPYLANAGAYPEVKRYWERYESFVQRLREEEATFYRAGLEEQLEAQGVYGSAQEIRIARAMQDFRADATRRTAHYADMEGLSRAALGLHDFLVRSSAAIRYAPVERGVTRDPILEVDVRDPSIRGELYGWVDRLLRALDAVAGPDPDRRRDVTRHVLGRIAAGSPSTAD